jgi:hypothetical protein
MVHTAVVLPRDLLERLRRDAEAADQGVSAEIRRRLQLHYDVTELSRSDPETTDLLQLIRLLAIQISADLGQKWHRHPDALAAFKAGVAALLAQYQPDGDESAYPDTRVVGDPDDPPEAIGRTLARSVLRSFGADLPKKD